MGSHEILRPAWPWIDRFGFAPAVRSGNTIHTCGLVAFDAEGHLVGTGDIGAQTRQVFENLRELLALGGATLEDVVKITAFLPDLSLYKAYSRARAAAFPHGVPASTAVGAALVLPELLVEIEAIAITRGG